MCCIHVMAHKVNPHFMEHNSSFSNALQECVVSLLFCAVCCSSSHCTSCRSVCDQLFFGSGHSSDNQRRERCSTLLCGFVWYNVHTIAGDMYTYDSIHLHIYSVFIRCINLLCRQCEKQAWIQSSNFLSMVDCLEQCGISVQWW